MSYIVKLMRKLSKYVLFPLVGIVLLWASYFLLYGNFHRVDKNVYRSAQLFSFNLPYYIKKHQIQSILNLRGDANKQWYKDEIKIVKEYNLTHYDYHIGDRRDASMQEMDKIVQIIKDAPKPLLIHCKAGADRTSLASALYLYAIKHEDDAEREISIVYGHFPWLGSKTVAMDRSFEKYKKEKSER
ncbi:MAG: tyrosine-protein phosphatase [Sulfurovum sp.]|nr:tyrosine-protein phosphatase [Sulfurovum sp.]